MSILMLMLIYIVHIPKICNALTASEAHCASSSLDVIITLRDARLTALLRFALFNLLIWPIRMLKIYT